MARGDFASAEEAARQLVGERIAERALEEQDDLAWAKPHVDEALTEVARGDVVSREEHGARNGRPTGRPQGVMARVIVTSLADADYAEFITDLAAKAGWRMAAQYPLSIYDRLADQISSDTKSNRSA